MPTDPGPYELGETALILKPDHEAVPKQRTPTFFEELGSDFGDFAGHVLISRFSFDDDWDTWELHPHGDEFVYLLSGDTDLVLHTAEGERTLRVSEPGAYVVVPRGTWHTARPHAPTTMLFVTPGQGTENRENPA